MAMSPRLLRPRATGFNPKSISGLAAWYDASKGVTLNGSTVSVWSDLSGSGRDLTQPTAANQPTLSSNEINALPAITTTSSTRFMDTAAWAFTNSASVFLVAKNTGTSFSGFFQRGAVNERHSAFRGQGAGNANILYARRADANEGTISYTSSGYSVTQFNFSTTLSQVIVNGTVGTSNTASVSYNTDPKILRVFSLSNGVLGMVGGIAEFLYYETTLSVSQQTSVRQYLGLKYKISTT